MQESLDNILIKVDDVSRIYRLGKTEVRALDHINLEVRRNEYLSIMGPSGSGKTTLFNMIGALDKPSSGKVYLEGYALDGLGRLEIAWIRCHKIGYIFQTFNLIPVMTALENVTLPMIFAGLKKKEVDEKGMYKLKSVGLEDRASHKPFELSGGQQQRVAIARALANDPSIILADEPTGNLDLVTGREIIELLKRLEEDSGVTIVTNTHDRKMLDYSDRIVYLRDGKVTDIKSREQIEEEIREGLETEERLIRE